MSFALCLCAWRLCPPGARPRRGGSSPVPAPVGGGGGRVPATSVALFPGGRRRARLRPRGSKFRLVSYIVQYIVQYSTVQYSTVQYSKYSHMYISHQCHFHRLVSSLFFFFVVVCRGVCPWVVGAGAVLPGPLARREPAPAPPPLLRSLVWSPLSSFSSWSFVVVSAFGSSVRVRFSPGPWPEGNPPPPRRPCCGLSSGSPLSSSSSRSFVVVLASVAVAAPVALRLLAGCAPGAVPRPLLGPWLGPLVFRSRCGRLSWSLRLWRCPPPWRFGS